MKKYHKRQIGKFYVIKKDSVECQICKKEFKVINAKHLSTHNLTVREYDHTFPFIQRLSLNTLYKHRKNTKRQMENPTKKQKMKWKESRNKPFDKLSKEKARLSLSKYMQEKVKQGKWINPALNKKAKKKIADNLKVSRYKKTIKRYNLSLNEVVSLINNNWQDTEIHRYYNLKKRELRHLIIFIKDKNNKHLIKKLKGK